LKSEEISSSPRVRRRIKDVFRSVVGRVPPLVMWLGVVGGIWFLSSGSMIRSTVSRGYAEMLTYSVAPLATGRVKTLNVQVGTHVKAGEVLVTMDPRALEAQLDRMKVELAQIDSQVTAQRDSQAASLARTGILMVRARAGESSDREELKELSAQVARLSGLASQQMVNASEVEEARRREAAVAAKVATYDRMAGQPTGTVTTGERKSATPTPIGDPRSSLSVRLAPYRHAVEVQEAAMREIQVQIEALVLRAPVDGVVALISHRAGEVVPAGTEVLNIVTATPGMIVGLISESKARVVSVGAPAVVQRPGFLQRKLTGRVVEISPQIDEILPRFRPSPTVPAFGRRVFIRLDQPQDLLPGEAFNVHL
jgi:multidrug resistance efflux pump